MIRRPPRSTHCISSAASDVYKRQDQMQSKPKVVKLNKLEYRFFKQVNKFRIGSPRAIQSPPRSQGYTRPTHCQSKKELYRSQSPDLYLNGDTNVYRIENSFQQNSKQITSPSTKDISKIGCISKNYHNNQIQNGANTKNNASFPKGCLLYTSPSPRDQA
eukprot:TRINITY_DN13859_c0_g1_i3.p3 TRINITY_DN13859_c0_g1~~TRINITY_DN13859_c0_g1_i3.p3  ORF type:complete len:160 (-),score=21.92 TRINITY_DN13859_c0_g1_i3:90-569(-)